jgi:hypothetical protein
MQSLCIDNPAQVDVARPMSGRVGASEIVSGQHQRARQVRVGIGFEVALLGGGPSAPPFFTDLNDRAPQNASSSPMWASQPWILLRES